MWLNGAKNATLRCNSPGEWEADGIRVVLMLVAQIHFFMFCFSNPSCEVVHFFVYVIDMYDQ